MKDTRLQLDTYALKTRMLPTIWSGAPLLVVVGVFLLPSVWGAPGWPVGGLLGSALLFLLAQLGRDRGKAIEPGLYRAWGGVPSVAMLRHRDSRIDRHTKERWHACLESRIPGLALATAAEEAQCPAQADAGYESATKWLLARTRDPIRFRLLHAENENYGFRRNVLGLKPYALVMDVICVAGLLVWLWSNGGFEFDSESAALGVETWTCLGLALVHLGATLCVRSDWVRTLADEYGHRLLACCDDLGADGEGNSR